MAEVTTSSSTWCGFVLLNRGCIYAHFSLKQIMCMCCAAGIDYVEMVALPGASMVLKDVDISIEDSTFSALHARGLAVITLSASNVTFRNCSFTAGSNSAGELSPPATHTGSLCREAWCGM